jgi:hypothetical protein
MLDGVSAYKLINKNLTKELSAKRNVGRTLTLLLMFLITIIVILVIFAYFSGLFGLVGTSQKNVSISGAFSVKNAGGPSGTLAFSVTNLSKTPMTGATLSCSSTQFDPTTCAGFALDVGGIPLSSQNPAGSDTTASGSGDIGAAPGQTFATATLYVFTLTLQFSDGTSQAYSESLFAQA